MYPCPPARPRRASAPSSLRAAARGVLGVSLLAVLLALGACDKSGKSSSTAALGGFGDSPLMPYVPADAPYVFATFQPVPDSYWERLKPMAKLFTDPSVRAEVAKGEGGAMFTAIADELGSLDAKRLEELGLTLKARMALYGMGVYPVLRIEIADGNRLFATVQRIAAKAGKPLGAPTEREGRRYWAVPLPDSGPTVVIAIASRELVFAMAPTAELDKRLPELLGLAKPAKALDSNVLRELARTHGFSAYGIGFADTVRLVNLTVPATATAACRTAIADFAGRAPRVVVGYGDLNQPVLEAGFIVEVAKDLVTDLQGAASQLPPIDLSSNPLFAVSVAADINKLRALGGRLGTALAAMAGPCQTTELNEMTEGLAQIANAPLPPALTSIRGFAVSAQSVDIGKNGEPTRGDGYVAVWADDAAALVATVASFIPQVAALDLKPDGQAREVMPGALPFPVHAIMQKSALAAYTGEGGAKAAKAALSAKPTRAPLMLFHYDYTRFFDLIATAGGPDQKAAAAFAAFGKTLGAVTMDATVDQRGLVLWMKMRFNDAAR